VTGAAAALFFLGVAGLIAHELDAVHKREWRLLFVRRRTTTVPTVLCLGGTDLCGRRVLEGLDEPLALVTMRHWTWLLDFWADLFDAYVELPGRRRRGRLGRRLAATLTAAERDPATVAAVLRDACVVPFFLTQIGAPGR